MPTLPQSTGVSDHDLAARLCELEAQKLALDEHAIVVTTDPSGVITYVNDRFCELSQYSREELIGASHRIINSGTHPKSFWVNLWRTIARGQVWHGEVTNRAKDGSVYFVQTTIVPVTGSDGAIQQFIAVRTDITRQKHNEQCLSEYAKKTLAAHKQLEQARLEAEAANIAKSQFLSNMSHEIRTPMTAIIGFADLLRDPDQSQEEQSRYITTIRRNATHLLGIINDILDLSKIEAGRLDVESTPCNPVHIIYDVEAMTRSRLASKPVNLAVEFSGPIPQTILTDPTRLKQTLLNLTSNAVKFTQRGNIRIFTTFVEQSAGASPMLRIEVSDSGIGISPEQMETIFAPFHQADETVTRQFGGTGLGLTISKHFAQALGGTIEVESEVGKGSRFTLTVATGAVIGVPMLEGKDVTNLRSPRKRASIGITPDDVSPLKGRRILLAEDGIDNQRLISFYLKKSGAEMELADNGAIAVEKALASRARNKPFDLILMDMQMPVQDGYSATRELRDRNWSGPIIALTAHAMAGDRTKCLDAGCDDYATKPINRDEFLEQCAAKINHARAAA